MLKRFLHRIQYGILNIATLALVVTLLLFSVLNVSILTGNIPAGSFLRYAPTGVEVIPATSFIMIENHGRFKIKNCTQLTTKGDCEYFLGLNEYFGGWKGKGSGVIVGHKQNRTFIMTAAHVCSDMGQVPSTIMIEEENKDKKNEFTMAIEVEVESVLKTIDYFGNVHLAVIHAIDASSDLCILSTEGVWGLAVHIADEMPDKGVQVQNMAAPAGIFFPEMILRFHGYYAGVDGNGHNFFTVPSTGGSSGSPILYNGKIISILTMAYRDFEHTAIGTSLDDIHSIMQSL